MKSTFFATTTIIFFLSIWQLYRVSQENAQLKQQNIMFLSESNILRDELRTLTGKRTYEDGLNDAIIQLGPTNGSYAAGYIAAQRKYENKNYTDGYHNAIQQFGFDMETNISLSKKE